MSTQTITVNGETAFQYFALKHVYTSKHLNTTTDEAKHWKWQLLHNSCKFLQNGFSLALAKAQSVFLCDGPLREAQQQLQTVAKSRAEKQELERERWELKEAVTPLRIELCRGEVRKYSRRSDVFSQGISYFCVVLKLFLFRSSRGRSLRSSSSANAH